MMYERNTMTATEQDQASRSNGGEVGESDLFGELAAMSARINAEIEQLEAQRSEIGGKLTRLRGLARALSGESAQAPQRSRPRQASKGSSTSRVGTTRLMQIAEAILAHDGGVFTATDVAQSTDVPMFAVYNSFRRLREIEFIGKAGKIGEGVNRSEGWRVLDRDALDKLKPTAAANGAA